MINTDSPPQLYIEDGAEWCVEWATVVGIGFLIDISWVCSDNALSEFVDADLDLGFPPSDRPKSKIMNSPNSINDNVDKVCAVSLT